MPRGATTRVAEPEPAPPTFTPNAIIASAANLTRQDLRPKAAGAKNWQNEAWDFYDAVGELRFGGNWMGNALSRVDLSIKRHTPDGDEDVDDGPAVEALDAVFGGETGKSQMMSAFGTHLFIAGETYLVGEPAESGTALDQWMVLSTEEIRGRGKQWTVDRGDGKRILSEDALILRIWRSHPRRWVEADSAVRAVLPILRELQQLTKHVAATIDSRLAGSGILLLPSEMSFASPPATEGMDPSDPATDAFLMSLAEAMVVPLEDRSNPAAVVPIVVRAPGALLGNAQWLHFDSPFDAQTQSLREEAIRRLALGLDMPPEVLLGQADSNHWSAWQIDEAALKVHIEPGCELIADGLTRRFIQPFLTDQGQGDPDLFVAYDTSELRTRPNHAAEAIELYDRLEINGDALRREIGIEEGDAPSDEERQKMLLLQLAKTGGDLQAAAVKTLGVTLESTEPPPAPVNLIRVGGQQKPPPAIGQQDPRAIPEPQPQVAALYACAEVLALRALERASNRVTHRSGRRRPCSAEVADAALSGEWEQVPRVAQHLGADADGLAVRLNAYVRGLLTTGQEHDPMMLQKTLMAPDHLFALADA